MPATLHLVATPIGNLEDVTLRALRVLREVRVIAAEDTRRSSKLLAHYGISTPLVSYHAHNSRARAPRLVDRLRAGDDVALVTDAGTPGISDPGTELVQACIEAGIPVNPVPGVSAVLAAAVASGFPLVPLTFFGFAPPKANDRMRWLEEVGTTPHTFCFFDAPTRIQATLREIDTLWGNRQMVVAREVTKIHQEFLRGTASLVNDQLLSVRGEFTVVAGPAEIPIGRQSTVSEAKIVQMFGRITEDPAVARRDAITAVAKAYRRPARDVYAAVERAKAGRTRS